MFAELTRRLGFEYSGMVNHEYYFENMAPGAQAEPPAGGKLRKALESSFGKYETWLADFRAIATMPGIGWAMTFQDPVHRLALEPLDQPAPGQRRRSASSRCS